MKGIMTAAAVIVTVPVILFLFVQSRLVAADEGFYLLAARLVAEGQHPYFDFFYPQMPALPYVYGLWADLFGTGWYSFRLLTSLLSSILALSLFAFLWQKSGRQAALFGIALLLSSGLFLGWFTVCKTYSLAGVFFFASFVLLTGTVSPMRAFAAGICLGAAINVRLFYLVLPPVLMLFLLWKGVKRRAFWAFLGGGLLLALPHLIYFLFEFESYWFSNVGYHLDRSYRPAHEDEALRMSAFLSLLGLESNPALDGYQFPAMLAATFVSALVGLFTGKRDLVLPLLLVLALGAIYLVPTPTHIQYFATLTPYLVAGAASLYLILHERNRAAAVIYALLMLLISIPPLPDTVVRFTETGEGVKAIGENTLESYHIPSIQLVSRKIDSYTEPGDIVLSQWPGFLVESHAMPFPGAENQFWVRAGHRLSKEQRDRVHVVSMEDFRLALFEPEVELMVLLQTRVRKFIPRPYRNRSGFERIDTVGRIYLYDRSGPIQDPPEPREP